MKVAFSMLAHMPQVGMQVYKYSQGQVSNDLHVHVVVNVTYVHVIVARNFHYPVGSKVKFEVVIAIAPGVIVAMQPILKSPLQLHNSSHTVSYMW